MKILVVDVAAEGGGALSVLNRYIERFQTEKKNEYIVCVGNLNFVDCENVKFLKLPWVKKSYFHRMFFDFFYIKELVEKYNPNMVFSLQNKGFNLKNIKQRVFFHNALFICEKHFLFKESHLMWLYQNVISVFTKKGLKNADEICVQAEWIKNGLVDKWNIDCNRISIDPPEIDNVFKKSVDISKYEGFKNLFYPAGFYPYKNHLTLLKACSSLWDNGCFFTLSLTGNVDELPIECKKIIEGKNYPITFLGKLSPEKMRSEYEKSALVFPSYIETVGLPLIEARNMGIAILAADCKYAHEAIGEYENVEYFSPLNVFELREVILNTFEK